jgi:3-oxoacyl-ACP reductase-like protein
LNFTTKFGTKFATFAEKLYEINCKTTTQLLLVKFNMADLLGKLVANYLVQVITQK